MYAPSERWDLEALYPPGVTAPSYVTDLEALEAELETIAARMEARGPIADDLEGWRADIDALLTHELELYSLYAVASCANAADTSDSELEARKGRGQDALGRIDRAATTFESALRGVDDATLEALATGPLEHHVHFLRHVRDGQRLKLPPAQQAILAAADREALHGWGRLFDQISASLSVDFERDGQVQPTSVGQLASLGAHPDESMRRRAFEARRGAFAPHRDTFATILTHITGTRQMRADRVGVGPLAQTLHDNRIDMDVVDAMFAGSERMKPLLVRYLKTKARLLGKPALDWWDLRAPIGTAPGGEAWSWSEAQSHIIDAFRGFHPGLADFGVQFLSEGGVEAEDRPNKAAGGFCAPIPGQRTTRVFLTFTGSLHNAVILAHELGHAWHFDLLFQQPSGLRNLTTALAESASILAENAMRERMLTAESDPATQLYMLDQQLQAGVSFLMSTPSNYRFERALYDLRREGPLRSEALIATLADIQDTAFGGTLATLYPELWAGKLHYYLTHTAFYNWSYTFGYLFSGALYARAIAEGPAFHPTLHDVLLRTGWQDCRGIARHALGEDLTDPDFWARAAAPLAPALERFEQLAKA